MELNEYVNQGVAFFQQGKFSEALESFESALKIQPGNADLRNMIEMVKVKATMASKATQSLANEARLRAEELGITDVDKAIAEFTEGLKRSPGDASVKDKLATAFYIRGLTFMSKGENARAVEDYSEAIKNKPDYTLAVKNRGAASLKLGNYGEAIKDFEKHIQLRPDYDQAKNMLAGAYMERGMAYDKKRDYAHAIPDYEMALKFDPGNSTTSELLAMAKAEMAKK